MIHLAIQSEYSFKKCFAKIEDIVKIPGDTVGVADFYNTFAHIPLAKACKVAGKKPIFGVRLTFVDNLKERFDYKGVNVLLLAKNDSGLIEINKLVSKAWDQFYWFPRLHKDDLKKISTNIFTINLSDTDDECFDFCATNFTTNPKCEPRQGIYIDDNNYINIEDKEVYQLLCGSSKRGDERNYNFSLELEPKHVLSEEEVIAYFGIDAVIRTHTIAEMCDAEIQHAEMVKFEGKTSIVKECFKTKKYDLLRNKNYKERFNYELGLIESKGYSDYFLIVSDMIRYAKRQGILVGPARGSSAGSLVCYLLDITEIDPIQHNLLFERFIDINRNDLPDIDIDFPDNKREEVINYLKKKYGESNVSCLANINTFQAKSAIGEFAASLNIPAYETDAVKGAIVVRSSGDARVSNTLEDTFKDTEAGQEFIKKYPVMKLVTKIENHASHSGKHAAGIIVSNVDLHNFGATNSRDGIIMMDKKSAEYIGLLKIDVLGLRTLSILADICKMIGIDYSDVYKLPLDDAAAYNIFQEMRLNAIFQFDGPALRNIVKQIGAHEFNDLALITALSRPGALNSGGTGRYIEIKKGNKEPNYRSEQHKTITKESLGVVVYQEQMMEIARIIGQLSMPDVMLLRQATSKSLGDEYFGKFKDKFIEGALAGGETPESADAYWGDIRTAGSWLFNKSHAVAYGMISYWTAYFKANHPLEFAIANLNHITSDEEGVKLLRDFVENEGFKYIPVDADESQVYWSVYEGKLLGGLTNIDGIGEAKAKKIIADRNSGKAPTPSIMKKLINPVTLYDDLFPCRTKFSHFYNDPISCGLKTKLNFIREVTGRGEYIIIGKIITRDIRDRNDYQSLVRREGKRVEGNSLYLRFIIEDDTDSVICLISHKNFNKMAGAEWAEIPEGTFVLINGNIKSDWRTIDITQIELLQ
jgi:DNA polymerase III alpha subunit